MILDGAEECQLSGPIGELVPFSTLKAAAAPGNMGMAKVSGPNEAAPVVQHLDLRQRP
jgi:hypothetical protein